MTDDYRPTTFSEVVGQPTDKIERLIEQDDPPNFLFYGPPGTGKTTSAHIIARRVQTNGAEPVEFNSSDERGIDAVRDNIIKATGQRTLSGGRRVIILEEMESMTTEAQQALRRPMEESGDLFVLLCNDVGGVHDAIRSRCREYEFGPLSETAIRERIEQLEREERADLTRNQYETIVSFASGDMRKAIARFREVAETGEADAGESQTINAAVQNLTD